MQWMVKFDEDGLDGKNGSGDANDGKMWGAYLSL